MKTKILCFLFFYVLFSFPMVSAEENEIKITAFYFSSDHCADCVYVKNEILPKMNAKYGNSIIWKELNIDENSENLELAADLVLENKKFGTLTPSLVIGKNVLAGVNEIQRGIDSALRLALSSPFSEKPPHNAQPNIPLSKRVLLPLILAGGLIDGVNPCAFAAIALLVSMMYVRSYTVKEIIIVSASYCLAVFISYFLIGLGAFSFIYSLKDFYRTAYFFRLAVGGLCFLLAAVSLYDFLVYKKTGRHEELLLKLPGGVKKKISLTLGSALRENSKKNFIILSLEALFAGILVSVMEMICTGQVYLPALVYIMKTSEHKFKAFSYIFLYNLMFVVPLLVVSWLYILGVRSETFGIFLKRHAGNIKILLASLFAALGGAILFLK